MNTIQKGVCMMRSALYGAHSMEHTLCSTNLSVPLISEHSK